MKAAQGSALPARWRRGRLIASIVTFLLTAIILYQLLPEGQADRLDSWWLYARFTFREYSQLQSQKSALPNKPDPEIVLALLDDRCLTNWKEPTIAWGPYIAVALDKLRISGAKVVALDWIQSAPTEEWFKGYDKKLQTALSKQHNIVFVRVFPPAGSPIGKQEHTFDGLLYAIPEVRDSETADPGDAVQGFAELNSATGVITNIHPALSDSDRDISFAARIVERWYGEHGKLTADYWEIPGRTRTFLREDKTTIADYAGGSGLGGENSQAFSHVSLYDLTQNPTTPDSRYKDKIVIIGNAYTGDNDSHFIPLLDISTARSTSKNPFTKFISGLNRNRLAPGVEIQANFVRTLLHAREIREPSPIQRWSLCMALTILTIALFLRLGWGTAALSLLFTAIVWIIISFGIFTYYSYAVPIMLPLAGLVIPGVAFGGYLAFSEERERRQVMKLWGKYQDTRLVNYLLLYPEARGGEGTEVEATVLFADLKDFTKTVESLNPSEALTVLNRYLSLLETVTIENGGLVDKYLGDGLMAQWGAPSTADGVFRSDHAAAAVNACLEIQKQAVALHAREPNAIHFSLRLTLHTGPVVVGWVGASRLEFTIIGDTVNVTSRLQESAKQLDCEFLISESTYAYVKDHVTTGKEAEVEIRGRKQALRVYEITSGV